MIEIQQIYINRFFKKISSPDNNGCINWLGAINGHGYGQLKFNGKTVGAHRFSYIYHHNKEIPKNLYVCHKCDNRKCVNINHLFLGTQTDNFSDCVKKGRNVMGERQWKSKLDSCQIKLIREMLFLKYKPSFIAYIFDITRSTVSQIHNNKTWKQV
jgi:hypothetical protein